ncbi:CheR family methyltransferase [Massilia suwonensis]|uniref:histidine kinase n=1 Tax=Massilia suwonensis TaxID=648895 RepID=A0ABW0MPY1_9BURK
MDEPQQPDLPDAPAIDNALFPIVGIGASAGGLPALIRLLENIAPAPGMALVVVLHLAPDAPSVADRILQRATSMPVLQVAERMPLRPNQVYVISPGRSLRMEDGHLIAEEPPCTLGVPMTINIFLRTLAEAHGERAIGVLLSGMGSDGVAGLACIKEHGGVSIAQLPGDAEERGMPQAAIDSGMVDFVLPAAQIPSRLAQMRDVMLAIHKGSAGGNGASALPPFAMRAPSRERIEEILSLLYAHTGQDFRHYRHATILRRIERRMQVRAVPDLPAYQHLLGYDPREPEALVQEMLIGVTNFFRDRAAFVALEESVLPRIFKDRKPSDPLRAWVTACSTGEEAYSVAMLLAERAGYIDGAPAMQIFATDIDERAIAVARAGRYPDAIAADVPPERLARYFNFDDGHFWVRRLLRDRILFARHDLLHDPAFSRLDLITCRNVLIYLNREVHRQLLELFHCALNPGGYLFLGSAESADLASDLFAPVDSRHRIYQARPAMQGARRLSIALPRTEIGRPPIPPGQAAPAPEPAAPPTWAELHQRAAARIAPPSVLIGAKGDILHASEGAGAFLRFAGGEPSTQLLALVLPELCADLRTTVFQAQQSGHPALSGPIRYRQDGAERAVELRVAPVREDGAAEGLLLVRFDVVDVAPCESAPAGEPGAATDARVRELEEALLRARRNLQQTLEQADAANAGLVRDNARLQAKLEELRAENEEFEVHREEMKSRNEELYTVNAELQARAEETAQANDDLSNLIASTDIATLFLDPRLRIQRYTPSVARIFNIMPADIGRPLAHLTSKLETRSLLDEVVAVFASGQPFEREARSSDGNDYIVRVHPYRTAYDRIEGAVLTFFDITSRRQAEKALRESEQRLALAFAALPVGLAIIGTDGTTMLMNEIMRRFMPAGAIPSRDPERAPRWRGWGADGLQVEPRDFPGACALRGESVLDGVQMLYRDEQGREIWTEVRSAPLRDSDGAITGALVVVNDVDQLKRSEAALRESEAHLRALVSASSDIVYRMSPDWTEMRSLQGKNVLADTEDPTSSWIDKYIPESERATVLAAIARAIEGKSTFELEHRVFAADGGIAWTLSRAIPLFDEAGEIVEWFGAGADITERKRGEEALRASEARFRALADASPALIWQIDARGALSYVNARCIEAVGAGIEQLRGLGWHAIVHPDDAPAYLDAVGRALIGEAGLQHRVRLRTAGGGYRWFVSHALPWYAADGQFQGLVGMSIDVEEAVQAEDALKAADRRKDEFLATLAHELRNPLAPISNALQFLRYPEGKRSADRLLAMVERQVRHMVRLIDDLMEVTRISRGKVDLRRAPVTLAAILDSAVETSLPAFEHKRQQLTVEPAAQALALDADKVRLTQVFSNLLNNASKYTAPGGQVWLTARREAHEVLVSVRDTGMGIAPEQLSMVFEMFSQPHGRDGHSDGGLGIGLAMVRSLVELHGGAVHAHSGGAGQGSEFVVRLPLHDCPEAALRRDDGALDEHPAPLAGRRILVVDDNRDAADSLCQLLLARGAEAQAVYGGHAAIEAVGHARPDAIVLDIGMPDMDGYEVARRIRREDGADAIRIVALSGWGQHADRQRSRESGFDHHLTKPAELHSLVSFLAGR